MSGAVGSGAKVCEKLGVRPFVPLNTISHPTAWQTATKKSPHRMQNLLAHRDPTKIGSDAQVVYHV